MNIEQLFDRYFLVARVLPVVLAFLPWGLFVHAVTPNVPGWFENPLVWVAAIAVLVLTTVWVRGAGRREEGKLTAGWGGRPSERFLLLADDHLPNTLKARYRSLLEWKVDGWKPWTAEEEAADRKGALAHLSVATAWLRENAAHGARSDLIAEENRAYGFRRNLYGAKGVGLLVSLSGFLGATVMPCAGLSPIHSTMGLLYWLSPDACFWVSQPFGPSLGQVITQSTVAFLQGASLFGALVWIACIRQDFVKDAAERYAERLLAACDSLE